jgi:hypothetical protein
VQGLAQRPRPQGDGGLAAAASSPPDAIHRHALAGRRKPVAARVRAAYSAPIDKPSPPPKETTMNAPQITTRTTTRLAAMAFSLVFTLAMLVSVDLLATTDAPATQMAQGQASNQG